MSGRFTITRDELVTQRLILQPRFETTLAAQRVERFITGTGLNNIEVGLRFRYEIRREFAPYFGVSFDRSFFGTADFVRQDGGSPLQIRFVAGIRLWKQRDKPNPEKLVQLVLAFKAHPQERAGQAMICEWTDFARQSEVTEGPTKPAPPRLYGTLAPIGPYSALFELRQDSSAPQPTSHLGMAFGLQPS